MKKRKRRGVLERLSNLDVLKIAFVDRAANKEKFLLYKSEESMPELTEAQIEKLEEFANSDADLGDAASVVEAITKADADAGLAVKTALVALSKAELSEELTAALAPLTEGEPELSETVTKSLAEIEKQEKLPPEAKRLIGRLLGMDIPTSAKSALGKLMGGSPPVEKKKQTDVRKAMLDGVPEKQREAIEKAFDAEDARIEAIEKSLAGEVERRELSEAIEKAEEITDGLPIEAEDFGAKVLYPLTKSDPEAGEELTRTLRALSKIAKDEKLFTEIGSDASGGSNTEQRIEKRAKAIAKAKELTYEQAYVEALDEDPAAQTEILGG